MLLFATFLILLGCGGALVGWLALPVNMEFMVGGLGLALIGFVLGWVVIRSKQTDFSQGIDDDDE